MTLNSISISLLFLCFNLNYLHSQFLIECPLDWEMMLTEQKQSFQEINQQFVSLQKGGIECAKAYKQFNRAWLYADFFTDKEGKLLSNKKILDRKKSEIDLKKVLKSANQNKWRNLGSYNNLKFSSVPGWINGSGRINVIIIHPDTANIWYAGAPNGGIWKSDNAGQSWYSCTTDTLSTLGISDIIFDPNDLNIMYALSGDRDKSSPGTLGVLKSIDNGNTWSQTSFIQDFPHTETFYRIIGHKSQPGFFILGTSNGMYRTVDNMNSWQLIAGANNLRFRHMKQDPIDNNIVHATTYTYSGASIYYRSNDFGNTWTTMPLANNTTTRRTEISIDPNDVNKVWLLGVKHNLIKLYKSTDRGLSFTEIVPNSPPEGISQPYYNLAFTVSPDDPNTLFAGFVRPSISFDGGLNWHILSGLLGETIKVHSDHHYFYINPHTNKLLSANDGGVWQYTGTYPSHDWISLNEGICNGEIYRVSSSSTNEAIVSAGTQDMGTYKRNTSYKWDNLISGDGMESIIHPSNPEIIFATTHSGLLTKSINGGFNNEKSWLDSDYGENVSFFWGFQMDQNTLRLLAGAQSIFESTDLGENWVNISGPITSGAIQDLAIAHSDGSVVYAVDYDNILKSINGGITWSTTNSPDPTGGFRRIVVDRQNANIVYANSTSGSNGTIYKSLDGGVSWENISGVLNSVASILPLETSSNGGVFVGTSTGVYYKENNTTWAAYGIGLPNLAINDIDYFNLENKLRVGTYGRGVWEINLDYDCAKLEFIHGTLQNEEINADKIISDAISILPGQIQTSFKASIEVLLNEGFEIRLGRVFEALIENCP